MIDHADNPTIDLEAQPVLASPLGVSYTIPARVLWHGLEQVCTLPFIQHDGGRALASFKGSARDCVTRAIAIGTGRPYLEVYEKINYLGKFERIGKTKHSKSTARTGVYKQTYRKYLEALGWRWVPTMGIGTGCKVHLRAGELPKRRRLIVSLSRHLTAVIDGVIFDTFDPSRDGRRCVYGYFYKP